MRVAAYGEQHNRTLLYEATLLWELFQPSMQEKLLYICKFNPYSHFGGGSIRNSAILELLKSKYEVSIACFSTNEADFSTQSANIYCIKYECSPVNGLLKERSLSAARFHSRAMSELIGQLTSSNDYTTIYVSELVMFQYVKYCVNRQLNKVILDNQNVESALLKEGAKYQSIVNKLLFGVESYLLSQFEKKAIERSSLLVLVSEEDRVLINSCFGIKDKTIVVPNCLVQTASQSFQEEVNKTETAEQNRFAIVGTLDWHANRVSIRWFLENIWKPFVAHNSNAELYLIGKKSDSGEEFYGSSISRFYNVEDVGKVLCSVDVGIAPLLYGGGSRVKILEYFYYGKPVIATQKGAEGLGLIPDVHYLLTESYSDFLNAVEKLRDVNFRNHLVNNGYEILNNRYNIELYKEPLLEAIEFC